jgi:hypothetical protein
MPDIEIGVYAEKDIDIGQSKVCIQNQYLLSHSGQSQSKIPNHIGFANAPLATGDGDNPGIGGWILGGLT